MDNEKWISVLRINDTLQDIRKLSSSSPKSSQAQQLRPASHLLGPELDIPGEVGLLSAHGRWGVEPKQLGGHAHAKCGKGVKLRLQALGVDQEGQEIHIRVLHLRLWG